MDAAASRPQWCRCVLPCGHMCYYARSVAPGADGVRHGPCLVCAGRHRENCPICLEPLCQEPVSSTECHHFFHLRCLRSRVEAGALHNAAGDPVSFDFLGCPLCRRSGIEQLSGVRRLPALKQQLVLKDMVERRQAALGSGRFVFQVCQQCTLPFSSGAEECHALARGKLEAVCPPCGQDSLAGKPRSCPKHGEESIAWKCRYCCSVATFECFSGREQLHTCDTCHELVEMGVLWDWDAMSDRKLSEDARACPVRRVVYWKKETHRQQKALEGHGKLMDTSEIKAVEHRLAVVAEQLRRCEDELGELHGLGSSSAMHRLQSRAHSLRVEKEDLEVRARAWVGSEALSCPLKGMHPPTGVKYCLGCMICDAEGAPGSTGT